MVGRFTTVIPFCNPRIIVINKHRYQGKQGFLSCRSPSSQVYSRPLMLLMLVKEALYSGGTAPLHAGVEVLQKSACDVLSALLWQVMLALCSFLMAWW